MFSPILFKSELTVGHKYLFIVSLRWNVCSVLLSFRYIVSKFVLFCLL